MLKPTGATLMELYGRGGINREANGARRNLNVKGLGALDLRTGSQTEPAGTSPDATTDAKPERWSPISSLTSL